MCYYNEKYGIVVHCEKYWENMDKMLDNYEKEIFPIDAGLEWCEVRIKGERKRVE